MPNAIQFAWLRTLSSLRLAVRAQRDRDAREQRSDRDHVEQRVERAERVAAAPGCAHDAGVYPGREPGRAPGRAPRTRSSTRSARCRRGACTRVTVDDEARRERPDPDPAERREPHQRQRLVVVLRRVPEQLAHRPERAAVDQERRVPIAGVVRIAHQDRGRGDEQGRAGQELKRREGEHRSPSRARIGSRGGRLDPRAATRLDARDACRLAGRRTREDASGQRSGPLRAAGARSARDARSAREPQRAEPGGLPPARGRLPPGADRPRGALRAAHRRRPVVLQRRRREGDHGRPRARDHGRVAAPGAAARHARRRSPCSSATAR